jgi:endonuclease/exonuclease/phosphatase family metal-dependent hydrolase
MSGKARAGIVSALVSSLAVVGLTSAVPPAGATLENTPVGKVLILSNNLLETNKRDARHTGDMRTFVKRAIEFAPKIPDVLLLQEVRAKSVAVVRSLMTRRTGQRYVTVVNAGKAPWKWIGAHKLLGSDTAIVINSKTMKLAGDKGSMKHPYEQSQARGDVKVKKTVYALLAERGSSQDGALRVPVASVHFPKQREFKSITVSQNLKERWSRQIAEKLSKKWPGSTNKRTIAGDFNNFRCRSGGSVGCYQTPAYNMLTKKKGYKDAILRMHGSGNPIDFIFTASNIVNAKWDQWQPRKGKGFYSDHDMRWAVIEGPDTTPPTDPGRISKGSGYGEMVHFGHWNPSRDGGTGLRTYEVWRAHGRDSTDWRLIGTTNTHSEMYKDYDVKKFDWYRYKVRPVDRADNFEESPVIELRAGTP